MTILANVVYHLCAKASPSSHPLASLAVTYAVALLTCVVLYPVFTQSFNFSPEFRTLNWAPAILGLSIVLLECGFILAYRQGWNLGNAALFSNVSVALILIPIAMYFYGHALTLKNIIGIILALSGLVLITK